ncbi:MAG: 50S ribosomal protein L16 [Planctomycetia bacterium]|nr:50S ribosomal protein L16 [Planctomycetia bacterium]
MAMMPKRVKRRKVHRGRVRGSATRGNFVHIGEYGIVAMEAGWVSAKQIEAGRVACNRALAGSGKVHIRIFPDKPVTSKPAETRMGKGKGEPEFWAAVVRPGQVLYEVQGAPAAVARLAFNRVAHKLAVQTRMIHRRPTV